MALYSLSSSQQITVKFHNPFLLISASLEQLSGAAAFTKLDLCSAYNLIRIHKRDDWKTTFVIPTGHYEYWVMPYGLVNATSVLQDFKHEVLRDFLYKFMLVYIDDIFVYSQSMTEQPQHVAEILQRLREYILFLKVESVPSFGPQ